jgi:hypothetical protein
MSLIGHCRHKVAGSSGCFGSKDAFPMTNPPEMINENERTLFPSNVFGEGGRMNRTIGGIQWPGIAGT